MMPTRRRMRVNTMRTHGAFLICMEMYGSGRRMRTQVTQRVPRTILSMSALRARFGSYGVVPGATTGRACVRRSAAAAPRAPASTISASVLVSKSSQTRPAPNWNCSGVPISRTSATSHGRSPATEQAMCGTGT